MLKSITKFGIVKHLFFVALALFIASCEKETDVEAPVVTDVRINGINDSTVVAAGSTIHVSATINDDMELSHARVRIIPDFSGIASATDTATTFEQPELTYVYNISGSQHSFSRSIGIPSNSTAGLYRVELRPLDASGRQGEIVKYPLVISNSSTPSVSLTYPLLDGTEMFAPGDTINLAGSISDNENLIEFKNSTYSSNWAITYSSTIDLSDTTITLYDLSGSRIIVPSSAEPGTFATRMHTVDKDGNTTFLNGKFNVQ